MVNTEMHSRGWHLSSFFPSWHRDHLSKSDSRQAHVVLCSECRLDMCNLKIWIWNTSQLKLFEQWHEWQVEISWSSQNAGIHSKTAIWNYFQAMCVNLDLGLKPRIVHFYMWRLHNLKQFQIQNTSWISQTLHHCNK
jgi:hypothetical protein